MREKILKEFPQLYNKFLDPFFEQEIPTESYATCNDCAMKCGTPKVQAFSPKLKCCTYFPKIPNYLIGAILDDQSRELEIGHKRVSDLVKEKIGVTPFGLFPPKKYSLLYTQGEGTFGNSTSLLCPYYIKELGSCSIWKYREAVCSTYFCKHVLGTKGKYFWDRLRDYMIFVQGILSLFAIRQLGLNAWYSDNMFNRHISLQRLNANEMDNLPLDKEEYNSYWGDWAGREVDFFIESHKIIKGLSREKVIELLGFPNENYLSNLSFLLKQCLSLPNRLKTNKDSIDAKIKSKDFIISIDEIGVQYEVPFDLLKYFDGSKTNEEINSIVIDEQNFEIDGDLLLSLYNYNLLQQSDNNIPRN